jgi:hypothetical protein
MIFLISVETITIGDKKIGIRTSVLEEKATACNMLCCYADELKEGFYPWIDQVNQLQILFLLIILTISNSGIRLAFSIMSIKSIPILCQPVYACLISLT